MNLRIANNDYQKMRRLTSLSFLEGIDFPPETGCIMLIGRNNYPLQPSLLVAEVLAPEGEDLIEQKYDGLIFSSSYLRRALIRVREHNLAGFFTVHTHPMSDTHVTFSPYDNANDPSLMANLYELQPAGIFGSIVLGKQAAKARLWDPAGKSKVLNNLIIVGEQIQLLPLNGESPEALPRVAELFDRGLAITGHGALAQLRQMRVGLVGGSGTGSLMAELLARAGVGEILIFEPDHIEEVNLNRILHSRRCDVESRTSKALRLAEAIEEEGLPTRVIVITSGNICQQEVALELRSCDLILGCVDRDWPRLILCEVAYQYLIPYIDLGTEIGIGENEIQSVDSRVSYIAPGRPCLLCSGIVSSERIRLEGMANDELERVIAMGYSEDIRLVAPAVMDLNMRAASYAMLVIRHLLQQFLDTPLPTHIKESLTNYSIKPISYEVKPDQSICEMEFRLGVGDALRLTTIE